jgi:hypothetical protein
MDSSNNFDNGFEKLDPLSSSGTDELVSSTGGLGDFGQFGQDLLGSAQSAASAMGDAVPLIPDIAAPQPSAPSAAEPVSTTKVEDILAPAAAPSPSAPEPVKPQPAQASTGKSWMKNIDPRVATKSLPANVIDLVYWRDPKKTGIVFGSMLVLLLSLALFSVLSVVAYLSLAALTVTVSFRVYKQVLQAVQKTGEGHPFKQYLEADITIPEQRVHQLAEHIASHLSCNLRELRRLFLVEDMVDSIKFGLLLWVLTYVGAWFNGMTLIILGVVSVFTLPKFYETHKTQIDQYIDLARTQIATVFKQIQEKIPLPGKKKQS